MQAAAELKKKKMCAIYIYVSWRKRLMLAHLVTHLLLQPGDINVLVKCQCHVTHDDHTHTHTIRRESEEGDIIISERK